MQISDSAASKPLNASAPQSAAPPPIPTPDGLYGRWAHAWVELSARHPWRILMAALLVTLVAAPFAAQLRIDTDLKKLLPRSNETVRQMDTAIGKVGDLGYFSIIIEHEDTDQSIAYAQAMAQQLRESGKVRTVMFENPVDFLKENRFLLLPLSELETLHRTVLDKRREKSPFNLGLFEEEPEPESSTSESPDEEEIKRPGDDQTLEDIKDAYFKIDDMERYHVSEDGRIVAMQIRPKAAVTDIGYVKRLYDDLVNDSLELKRARFPADMEVDVSGSLRNKLDEFTIIIDDLVRSAWVSGLLILLVLYVFFRSTRALLALVVPLLFGLCWTFGLAALAIGFLNTISSMLFVVLFGLGIDHGIHLLRRYIQTRQRGYDAQTSMSITLTLTGKAVWVSALTTAGGFLLMLLADFKGFTHLGFIAGTSMLLITSAYFVALPAMTFVLERGGRSLGPQHPLGALWAELGGALESVAPRWGWFLGIGLLAAGTWAALQLQFNYDFDTLKGTIQASEKVKEKQAKVYKESLTPGAILFAPDDTTLDAMLSELERRKTTDDPTPTIGRLMTIRDFLPGDQEARLAELREAARLVTPLVLKRTEDRELRKVLKGLQSAGDSDPIAESDVPAEIRDFFRPQDGSSDRMLFVFPSIERKQGEKAIQFADDMSPLLIDGKRYVATGDTLVFAEILRVVVSQGLWIFGLSLLAIALLLYAQFRRIGTALHIFMALAAGLGLMALVLLFAHVDINFYNMVIFAAVVGMGVDAAIHVGSVWLWEREHDADNGGLLKRTLGSLGGPITASVLTTMAGYLGMIFSQHPGLHSIGVLAVVGLGACYVVAILLFPLTLRYLDQKRGLETT